MEAEACLENCVHDCLDVALVFLIVPGINEDVGVRVLDQQVYRQAHELTGGIGSAESHDQPPV